MQSYSSKYHYRIAHKHASYSSLVHAKKKLTHAAMFASYVACTTHRPVRRHLYRYRSAAGSPREETGTYSSVVRQRLKDSGAGEESDVRFHGIDRSIHSFSDGSLRAVHVVHVVAQCVVGVYKRYKLYTHTLTDRKQN